MKDQISKHVTKYKSAKTVNGGIPRRGKIKYTDYEDQTVYYISPNKKFKKYIDVFLYMSKVKNIEKYINVKKNL